MANTRKLDELEAEADENRDRFEAAMARLQRKAAPARLADRAVGKFGPAAEVYNRIFYVARRNSWATAIFAVSAGWLLWQFLRSGKGLVRIPTSYESRPAPRFKKVTISHQRKENLHGNITTHGPADRPIQPQQEPLT